MGFLSFLQHLEICGIPFNMWRNEMPNDLDNIMDGKWNLTFIDYHDSNKNPISDRYIMECYRTKLISRLNCHLLFENEEYTTMSLQMSGEYRNKVNLKLAIPHYTELTANMIFEHNKYAHGKIEQFNLEYKANMTNSKKGIIDVYQGQRHMIATFNRIGDVPERISPLIFIPVIGIFGVILYMVMLPNDNSIPNKNEQKNEVPKKQHQE